MQSNAIADATHSKLPDSEADAALLRCILLKVAKSFNQSQARSALPPRKQGNMTQLVQESDSVS